MTSVEKSIIPLFEKYISQIADLSKYDITKTVIKHKETGSFILFSGIKTSSGDQTGNLKSLPNITTWVVEEGEDFNNEKSFTDIDDSIRTKGMQNRVIWIQNPTHREHFIYKKFFIKSQVSEVINDDYTYIDNDGKVAKITYQKSTHPQVEHIHTTYLDNLKNLDELKIEQWNAALKEDARFWANKYGGAWVDMMEGAIFEHVNWIDAMPTNLKRFSYGMDFGFTNDPTTLIKCGVSDGELFAERWIYEHGMTTEKIDIALKRLGVSKKDIIIADNADPKTIEELQTLGWFVVGCKKGADSIRFGISEIKKYKKLNIVHCEYWKMEQISYIWAKDSRTGQLLGEPSKNFNHLWDSLRYGIQGLNISTAGVTYS
jgi:phage terminase large subunit